MLFYKALYLFYQLWRGVVEVMDHVIQDQHDSG